MSHSEKFTTSKIGLPIEDTECNEVIFKKASKPSFIRDWTMKEFITISSNDMCVEYISDVLVFGKEKWHKKC